MFRLSVFHHFFPGEEVDGAAQVGIPFVPVGRTVIALCVAVDNLFAALTEDVDIFLSNRLADLHVGAVHCSEGQRAVQHELHVSCSGGFL